jgi:hypothetical protein
MTDTECIVLFPLPNGYINAPQFYCLRTLPVFTFFLHLSQRTKHSSFPIGLLIVQFPLSYIVYEVIPRIFRTDDVKIIKLTIRPIGRHLPRSSSLPNVDTGPTVSSIFGTLPGSPFLSECQALSRFGLDPLSGIKPASF